MPVDPSQDPFHELMDCMKSPGPVLKDADSPKKNKITGDDIP